MKPRRETAISHLIAIIAADAKQVFPKPLIPFGFCGVRSFLPMNGKEEVLLFIAATTNQLSALVCFPSAVSGDIANSSA
jgi:hypothetical protein